MAIVDLRDLSVISKMYGIVDYYKLKNSVWVARVWPKKPAPPYTELQKEYQYIFRVSRYMLQFLSDAVLGSWRSSFFGKKPSWLDVYTMIFLRFYKIYGVKVPVVVDFKVDWDNSNFRVVYDIVLDYDLGQTSFDIIKKTTDWFNFDEVVGVDKYFLVSLFTEEGVHCCCPFIKIQK